MEMEAINYISDRIDELHDFIDDKIIKTPKHRLSISSNNEYPENINMYNSRNIKKCESFNNIKVEPAPFIDSYIISNRVNNIDNALLMDDYEIAWNITNKTIIQLRNPGIVSIKRVYLDKIISEFKSLQINLYKRYIVNAMKNITNLQNILQNIY